MAHYAFYFLPDAAVHAFCHKRAALRYPALVTRDAVNELRGCVTYNQRSKWGLARRPRRRQIGTKRSHGLLLKIKKCGFKVEWACINA